MKYCQPIRVGTWQGGWQGGYMEKKLVGRLEELKGGTGENEHKLGGA